MGVETAEVDGVGVCVGFGATGSSVLEEIASIVSEDITVGVFVFDDAVFGETDRALFEETDVALFEEIGGSEFEEASGAVFEDGASSFEGNRIID